MQVKFWGTRGSMAKPGPSTVRYGGNTSCVQVVSDSGTQVIIDCGTGAHGLGQQLLRDAEGPIRGHILISHTHWDHIQGFPFFAPLFIPGNEWDVYAPHGFGQSLQETLAGQMQYTYFPVTLEALGADIRYHDLTEGELQIGDIRVVTHYLNHPALTLGFRLEVDGATVIYSCDHEPHDRELAAGEAEFTGPDQEHVRFLQGADLVIHDAQYTASEFADKVGWGHSTVEYAIAACRAAGVKQLALTHHDPLRNDEAVDRIMSAIAARQTDDLEVFAAAEGQVLQLRGATDQPIDRPAAGKDAAKPPTHPGHRGVLLALDASDEARLISEAVESDRLELMQPATSDALDCYREQRPDLVLVAADTGPDGGLALARAIRAIDDEHARQVTIVGVSQSTSPPQEDAISDWLIAPFSTQYARSRIRAWLLRVACRWERPPLPQNEKERLAALRRLQLLDTAPEARFDRITRLATAIFEVPVALVSLVDADRQWFKSCSGASERESSREISFCAHAIQRPEALVVTDTLDDDRFADNPVVSDGPRVRFYAGHPLSSPDGYRVGTLCLVDRRPRELSPQQLSLLADLAGLVEREMAASP